MNTITPAKKPEITYIEPESPKQPDWRKLMFALLFFAAVIYAAFNMEDFVVENEGQLELSSKRKAKKTNVNLGYECNISCYPI
jgi:hypothetical protein